MAQIPEITDQPTTEQPERTVAHMLTDWSMAAVDIDDLFDDDDETDEAEIFLDTEPGVIWF